MSFINSAVGKNKGKRFQDSEIFDRILGTGGKKMLYEQKNGVFKKEAKRTARKNMMNCLRNITRPGFRTGKVIKRKIKNDLLGKN